MPKFRSPAADYAVYLFIRLLVCFIQSLSVQMSYTLAGFLSWVAYRVDRRHSAVAVDNLRQAFPERFRDPASTAPVVRAVYRHFCVLLVDIMHMPRRLHTNNWRRHVQLPSGGPAVDALLSGRPVLFVTAHFGNWEMGGYVLGLLGFTTHAIARTLDNRYLDRFLLGFRERTGQKILDKSGDFDRIQAVLKRGGVLATLGDQDAGPKGLFVDFFGRPASTHKAVALLALGHKVPLVVIGTPRVGEPMHYAVTVEDVILPEEYEWQPDAVRMVTQRFTAALERLIRRHPEQYLWLHRRWKHQPAPGRKQPARSARPRPVHQATRAVDTSGAGI
jgi:KDO2-lipid IV(A) lauroyltransferase